MKERMLIKCCPCLHTVSGDLFSFVVYSQEKHYICVTLLRVIAAHNEVI